MSAEQQADDRTTWLAWRRLGLGGSDIASVVGLSPWKSQYALWAEKVGLVEDDDETEMMEFGRRAEGLVAGYFRDRTGLEVAGEQQWLVHAEHEWMRATADGFVFERAELYDALTAKYAVGVLEIKVTSSTPEEWEAELPDHYLCQAQWLLAVTGKERVWFAVLHTAFGRLRFRTYEVERDDADIAYLMAQGLAFWRLVCEGTPPPADGSDSTTRALQRAWEARDDAQAPVTFDLYRRLLYARSILDQYEEEVAALTNAIKVEMGEASEGTVQGATVCTWRPSKAVDLARLLAELDPVEIAAFSRFDLGAWTKKNRLRAAPYRTEPGPRRFVVTKERAT